MATPQSVQQNPVVISGALTREQAPSLRAQLESAVQQAQQSGDHTLQVRWENPGEIDGIGLALLVATHLDLLEGGGKLCLLGLSDKHQELLRITRLDQSIEVLNTAA